VAFQSETAAPKGSIFGNGGSVVSKAVTAQNYPTPPNIATPSSIPTSIAVAIVAERWSLSPPLAAVVCELANLGGRLA